MKKTLVVDISLVGVEDKKQVNMMVHEEDISKGNIFNSLCNAIDDEIGTSYPQWRHDFAVAHVENEDSILDTNDLIKILNVHKNDDKIFFIMKSLLGHVKKTRNAQVELNKLKIFQNYWSDDHIFHSKCRVG